MLSARFQLTIDAPIERVWALLTDYAGYARFPKVRSARVLEPGKDHPARRTRDGRGAQGD